MRISMIVAADLSDTIGRNNELPWYLPSDLAYFKRLTTGHTVIVGRRTQDSIVERLGKSLPNRSTIVVTHQDLADEPSVRYLDGVYRACVIATIIETARHSSEEIFIIGGLGIYTEALKYSFVERVYLTRVHARVEGNVVLPVGWLDDYELIERPDRNPHPDDEFSYELLVYDRRPS